MPAPETFTTERLVARRVDRDDRPFLVAMWRDPSVTVTLGGPRDTGQVDEMIEQMMDHWQRRGFGIWILRDRATDEPVGWVGLEESDVGGSGGVELLYAIASDRWREGLATEAGHAAIRCAADTLELRELVCFTLVDNLGSQRTMAGLGFAGREPVEHAGLPHVLTRRALSRSGATQGSEMSERG